METTYNTPPRGDRSLISLFSDLFRETRTLVHDEVELARVEMSEKVSQIESGLMSIAIAGAVLFAGFLMILIAATAALGMVLPLEYAPWLAPLLVGAVVMLIGWIALANGRRDLRARNLTPTRSMESLRRDRDLVKEHVR